MSENLIGKTLDDFVLEGELGKGGMGVVYLASEEALHRKVAIKILPDHLAENESFLARFSREARAVAQLNHGNVVTIYRVGQARGYHYIAMEFVQGLELNDMLKADGPLPFDKVASYMRQAASALDAAHSMGILHRDIKPQNIMVDNKDRVKVMDFGIAKLLSSGSDDTAITMDGTLLGTPTHMSPEQCEGNEVDARADIYSLGVVMFQCITGRVPMTGETPLNIIQKILNEKVPDVRTIRKDTPACLAAVVKRATEKDRNHRFESAADLEKALGQCQQLMADGAVDETFVKKISFSPSRQSRGPLMVVVGLVAVVLAGAFVIGKSNRSSKAKVESGGGQGAVTASQITPTPAMPVFEEEDVAPPPGVARPEIPQGLQVTTNGLREVILTWVAPVDQPAKFQVERSLNPPGPYIALERVSPQDLKFVDRGKNVGGFEDNSTYYYRMFAVSDTGIKSKSSPVMKGVTAPPPAPPVSLTLKAPSSRCVTIQWPASASPGVVEYRLERAVAGENPTFEWIAETKVTRYRDGGSKDTDLKDSTTYLYRVQAVNKVESVGRVSEAFEVVTQPPPTPVANVTALSDEVRCVPLEWAAHPDEAIEGYTVYRASQAEGEYQELKKVQGRDTIKYLDGGKNPGDLTDDTEYFYRIVAYNNLGVDSVNPTTVSARTRKAPPVVEGLEADSGQPREVPLRWTPSVDEKVVGYILFRQDPGKDSYDKIAEIEGGDTAEYLDRGQTNRDEGLGELADGATYAYRIVAFNAGPAMSEDSAAISASTKPAPKTPTMLAQQELQAKQVTLRWQANPEADIVAYEIEGSSRSNRSFKVLGEVRMEQTDEFVFVEDGLDHGQTRYYRVRALDATGLHSGWSDTLESQSRSLPNAPEEISVSYAENGATISWSASTSEDVVKYKVYKNTTFIRWIEQGEVSGTAFVLDKEALGKSDDFAVTAVDKEGLESKRSKPIEVRLSEVPDA